MKKDRFEIRISSHLRDRLNRIAKQQGMSDSEAARLAIRQWVEKEEGKS